MVAGRTDGNSVADVTENFALRPRQLHVEGAALSRSTVDADRAVEQGDEPATERQADADTLMLAVQHLVELNEVVEDLRLYLR